MEDNSLSTDDAGMNPKTLKVKLDTLEVDKTRPTVGDHVDLEVTGTVQKIVNDCAYVLPETINGEPTDTDSENEPDLGSMAAAADASGGGY